ncbi:uncharacterized protein LOC144452432 [Glandiceps talaboti]
MALYSIMISFILCVMYITSCLGNPVKRQACQGCQEPSLDDLQAMLSTYTPNALHYGTTPGAYSPPSDVSCPISYGSGAPLEIRSTCPFYQVENTVIGRFPPTLVEAGCYQCDGCITDLLRDQDYHPMWECEQLKSKVWALQKTGTCSAENVCDYEPVEIELSIACTCGRERL